MSLPFLLDAGTAGFIQAPFNLLSTELNSLASGAAVISSVGGTSGVFNQTNSSQAIWSSLYFTSTGTFTPTGGPFLAGWFLLSSDGGTTFEGQISSPSATVPAIPRAPDFSIPLDITTYSTTTLKWCQGRRVQFPWESYQVLLQNLSGVALPSSGNTIKCGGVAIQY